MATEIAALRSHKSILEHSLSEGHESVFILEDDVDFCEDFLNELSLTVNDLPEDWEGLHLGGYSPQGSLLPYSSNLFKCNASWGGYGYIVSKKIIPFLLELISQEKTQVDTYYARAMPQLKWFKSRKMLVKHLPGFSTIQKKNVDYKDLY
jgi:GR25 family glycosyltransferase involved in LPS biosynthesis